MNPLQSKDIQRLLVGHMTIEAAVFFSRTCKAAHALVSSHEKYVRYKSVVPAEREAIIAEAIAEVQKQYLLRYLLAFQPALYKRIAEFAGKHCSVEECAWIWLHNFQPACEALEYGLALAGRKDAILQLYGKLSDEGLRGLVSGKHYELLAQQDSLPPFLVHLLAFSGDQRALPFVLKAPPSPDTSLFAEGRASLGILSDEEAANLTSAGLVCCLDRAQKHGHNDLFCRLLELVSIDRIPYIIHLGRTSILENEACWHALRAKIACIANHCPSARYLLDSQLSWSLGQKFETVEALEDYALRKTILIDEDSVAKGAAWAGHEEVMLHFYEMEDTKNCLASCLDSAAAGGHFALMQRIVDRMGSVSSVQVLQCIEKYPHDDESVVEWLLNLVSKVELCRLLSTPSKFLKKLLEKPYSLQTLVQRGVLSPNLFLAFLNANQRALYERMGVL